MINELLKPIQFGMNDRLAVGLEGEKANEFRLRLTDARGHDFFPSAASRVDFPKRFPQHRSVSASMDTVHIVPATDVAATLIRDLWPPEQVEFTEEAQLVYQYQLGVVGHQHLAMRRTARYHEWSKRRDEAKREGREVPPVDFVEDFGFAGDLRPMVHQRVGWRNSLHTDGYSHFAEQGTGKTGMVIARVDSESLAPELGKRMYCAIIAAPKNVRQNWASEFARFSKTPGRVIVLKGGSSLDRRLEIIQGLVPQFAEQRYVVFITSYECLTNSWETIGSIQWDLGVLDESHFIKWPRTKRAKIAFQLRERCRARMCLTGTPVCNTPVDLYSQLEFMREGGSGFSNFEAFRKFYGVFKITDPGRGIKRLVDVQNLPFMQERLARMCFVVRKDEALPDLPEKMYDIAEVEMSKEQRAIYESVRDQLYYEIKNDLDDTSKTVNPQNILTKLLRLSQITSGFVTLDPVVDLDSGETVAPKVIEAIDPNPKLDALVDLFFDEEDEGARLFEPTSKTLIACTWVWDIHRVHERLTAEGLSGEIFYGGTKDADRETAVRRFNEDPECNYMVVNPAAGGVGLNLVGYDYWNNPNPLLLTNCDHIIFYSQNWSNPQRSQFEDRAHRAGTRVPVRYTDLVVPETIDEEIRARVLNKRRVALEVQDVRGILSRILGKDV